MSDSEPPRAPKDISLACLSDMEQLVALSKFSMTLNLDVYVAHVLLLPHLLSYNIVPQSHFRGS
jgi:hypothetical protein